MTVCDLFLGIVESCGFVHFGLDRHPIKEEIEITLYNQMWYEPELGAADKLFTPRLIEGNCGVYFPTANESLVFAFDSKQVPYLGLWICQGGWPSELEGDFTVAPEACNGPTDSLEEAITRGDCGVLPALGKVVWELRIEVHADDKAGDRARISG